MWNPLRLCKSMPTGLLSCSHLPPPWSTLPLINSLLIWLLSQHVDGHGIVGMMVGWACRGVVRACWYRRGWNSKCISKPENTNYCNPYLSVKLLYQNIVRLISSMSTLVQRLLLVQLFLGKFVFLFSPLYKHAYSSSSVLETRIAKLESMLEEDFLTWKHQLS